jgi:hypothetical protein
MDTWRKETNNSYRYDNIVNILAFLSSEEKEGKTDEQAATDAGWEKVNG